MDETVLITGGAGFIGSNLADRLLEKGYRVRIFDNLSRKGVEQNWRYLHGKHELGRVECYQADVANPPCHAYSIYEDVSAVFHFAAQVAVTTSFVNPMADFEVNARGTLNVMEAVRQYCPDAPVFFTSTNKVYGDLSQLQLAEQETRYRPRPLRRNGVGQTCPLDFHSPYGCSKGAADQYVRDYARGFGLKTVVFRMSCVYGPHQCGNEDQGWVSHFVKCGVHGLPLTIYGSGKQVRDLLYIDDLVGAFLLAWNNIKRISGSVFNIGGGPQNAASLLELIEIIQEKTGEPMQVSFEDWRPGDQLWYVSDTSAFETLTGWRPLVNVHEGVARLYNWIEAQ